MKTKTTPRQSKTEGHGYTPGPWTFDEVWMLIKGANGVEVAACHTGQPDGERPDRTIAHANAHLMKAAPNLFKALKEIMPLLESDLDAVENWQQEAQIARAALAEAMGHS